MADCVVTLHHRVSFGTAMRFLRVAKFRGAQHSANEIPFSITHAGIEVASNTARELDYPVSTERISTGIERLDAMLAGGYHRGSSILITGAPGTAKTSLVASFASAAAARGERTMFVSFDEAPAQITRNVASIGIQLQPHIDSGMLTLRALRGHAESPEMQVARLREALRELQPLNLVIDPLSALVVPGGGAGRETAALEILDFAKSAGITVVSSSLIGTPTPLTEQTTLNVSTIADTWMHVSYVSQSGERNRALTIVKARGTRHSNQVRELVLDNDGVTLADVYTVDGDVLMGTLRWEKENEARRKSLASRYETVLRERKAELALAQTKAQRETLARAQIIQEDELAQIKADTTMAVDRRTIEAEQLLIRRHADAETTVEVEPEP
jgi:circadian clock protein KaiC